MPPTIQPPDAAAAPAPAPALTRLRRRSLVAGLLLLVEAVVLGVVVLAVSAADGHRLLLTVTAALPGSAAAGAASAGTVALGSAAAGTVSAGVAAAGTSAVGAAAAGTAAVGTSALGAAAAGVGATGLGGVGAAVTRVALAQVDVGAAVVVLCLLAAAGRFVWVIPPLAERCGRALAAGRRTARWVEFSLTASITVFLVAGLNGVLDVSALVALYALTSGAVLFTMLQERARGFDGHPKLALCFAAGVGIVPWGVIAFYQVAAGVAGVPPTVAVRAVTLVMLAFAFAFAITQWRELPATPTAPGLASSRDVAVAAAAGEWRHAVLTLASVSVFAWIVVAGILQAG